MRLQYYAHLIDFIMCVIIDRSIAIIAYTYRGGGHAFHEAI